jgi:NarL family two-component system response regulator LiaR
MLWAAMPQPLRILVVEDHTLLREGLIAMLEAYEEFEVAGQTGDGADGLRLALELLPDVVLLDLRLPGMDGLQALRELKVRAAQIKVIVLTVHEEEAYVGEALRSGADGYMLKTISHQELADAVRRVAAGEAVLHPAVARKVLSDFAALSKGERLPGQLSGREREVVELLAEGLSNKQIARRLEIGVETVKTHVSSILEKLGAADRTQAVVLALRRGLVE